MGHPVLLVSQSCQLRAEYSVDCISSVLWSSRLRYRRNFLRLSLSKQNNKKVETFTLTPHNTQELTSESVQLKLLRGICLSTDILPF